MTAAVGRAAVEDRLASLRSRVAAACSRVGRDPGEVTVVGVTKSHPAATAQAAVEAGLADLGENRVHELVDKAAAVRGARWHFVGRLQSNKARDVVGRVDIVHSVDRRSLVDELAKRAAAAEITQRVLIQVNVGEDPAKGGCDPDATFALVDLARHRGNLAVEGLMTVPPLPPAGADPAETTRPYFARLRELGDKARARWPEVVHLSMGMSADFEAAVEEGATIIRIGSALFGPRDETADRDRSGDPQEQRR